MSNIVLAAGGDDGYQISRSVRFRNSATAYFNRTSLAGNQKKYTISFWMKRGALVDRDIISSKLTGGSYPAFSIGFDTDRLRIWDYTGAAFNVNLYTTAVYRDPSAWYHIVVAVDTTQAVSTDRVKLYVNGSQVTSFSTATYPAQNTDLNWNAVSNNNTIGGLSAGGYGYFDGYLADVIHADGQYVPSTSFGENDAVTGVWKPKKYAGTYGTNGFWLTFSDNSAATAAAIGKDSSGNGNNWTPNNISVTAGVTYDSMLDVPTPYADGGNGRGNYAVLNPVNKTLYQPTISDGNLTVTPTTTQYQNVFSTFAPTSGKWYCEVTVNGTANSANMIGVSSATEQNYLTTNAGIVGVTSTGYGYYIYNGNKYTNGSASVYGNSIASGDVVGIALDLDSGKVFFSKNGTWQASGDPVAGTNAAFTGLTSSLGFFISSSSYSGGATSFNHNFGQRPFAYTPPTGFKALNTQNLPDSTIKKGNAYFDVSLWTGNGTSQSIVNSGGFQPDLVWQKERSDTGWNNLVDSVRGAGYRLFSNTTNAESYAATNLTSFNSNGFSVGNDVDWNQSGQTSVAWQWKKGATPGFDIVTYTGNGTARTIAHSLGVKPSMIILKNRSGVYDWPTWHQYLPNPTTQHFWLNATNAAQVSGSFNSTQPTSSVFSVGTTGEANANGNNFVAYLFAEVAGFSKFGSYTGNGSADGPFVYLGFRPRYVMVKRTDAINGNWEIFDTARSTYNVNVQRIFANDSSSELTGEAFDMLSNGFKCRLAGTSDSNTSGGTYIYAAFAENPFKNSLAR